MQESHIFGTSVYVSTFDEQLERLKRLPPGSYVFTSLHVQEEAGREYKSDALRMLQSLKTKGFRVIADVSSRTLDFFGIRNMAEFARKNGIERLRLDYGFSTDEAAALASVLPIAINASMLDLESAARIKAAAAHEVYAIHNFYPRPETGLDDDQLMHLTQEIRSLGIKVFAFIPGDIQKRGPIFEGLPTLESHRGLPPYVACVELFSLYGLDGVFVGDSALSKQQFSLIIDFIHDDEIRIPSLLYGREELYDQTFTVRADSPTRMLRLGEARAYASVGEKPIEPAECSARSRGSITIDNLLYARYCGEIQVLKKTLPADRRVNVIGHVDARYLPLLDCVRNGQKIRLVRSI